MAVTKDPFKASPVFAWNFETKEDIVINQGGTSSGKTYSILQALILKTGAAPNQVTTVTGEDMPNLKVGAMRDFKTILRTCPFLASFIKGENKTDKTFYFNNGSLFEFKTYDTPQDAKSGKRDFLFINEANGVPYEIYQELEVRTKKQVYLDYNPTAPFWVHSELLGNPGVVRFISNFTHNCFVDPKTKKKILAYKKNNPERWRVYGLGKTGQIEGSIFSNVSWVDSFPQEARNVCFGLDFGFTNDPTAIVKVGKLGGELWVENMFYSTHMTNQDIARELKKMNIGFAQVYCDSAEPKSIEEIRREGVFVQAAYKGRDSVSAGINKIKEYKLNIVVDKEFKFEVLNYTWLKDKRTGRYINKPIDKHNHLFDALRYAMSGVEFEGGILASG